MLSFYFVFKHNGYQGKYKTRNLPRLQREASQRCVVCGTISSLYCAGCRVTPYCSEQCQRRDWEVRHQGLCHNLVRLALPDVTQPASAGEPETPAVLPLRRPHSPDKISPRSAPRDDSGNDNDKKHVQPARKPIVPSPKRSNQPGHVQNSLRNHDHNSVQNRNQGNQDMGGQDQNRAQNKTQGVNRRYTPNVPLRQPMKPVETKPAEPVETKPADVVETKSAEPTPDNKPKSQVGDSAVPKAVGQVAGGPLKPLVPSSYIIEKLPTGSDLMVSVVDKAINCGSSQPGFTCLMLHEDYGEVYHQLCDAFAADCGKDTEDYTPTIGETFAYLDEEEGWYRARCLARTSAALLDSGRIVSFAPSLCRKLPVAYGTIPEFVGVLNAPNLEIGANLKCTLVGSAATGKKLSVSGQGDFDVMRWSPIIEYSTERPRPQLRQETPAPEQSKTIETKQSPKPVAKQQAAVTLPPLVPDSFMVKKLPIGSEFLAEVVHIETSRLDQFGYTCLMLHQDYENDYNQLCDAFATGCEKDKQQYKPQIGETFAYFCKEDESWYRARYLGNSNVALLDTGRTFSIEGSQCRKLPAAYANIPEFVAVLKTKVQGIQVGTNLSCTVTGSSSNGIKVSVTDVSGKSIGDMDVERWMPDLVSPEPQEVAPHQQPQAPPQNQAQPALNNLPEPPRPCLEHNSIYELLDATSLRRACVRPCDPHSTDLFHAAINDTVLYGIKAMPLKEPPRKGQMVVAKFTDDMHYRAMVKRVNVAKNKYLVEYIEYGNEEIVPLERLYPCPPNLQLDAMPTQSSIIMISEREPATLTPKAQQYIEGLKEAAVELILTIPGGAKKAPSGSLAALLTAKDCEPICKNIEKLCTPAWMQLAERGGDVGEFESRKYHQLQYVKVPTSRPFTIKVTHCDVLILSGGSLSGFEKGNKTEDLIYGTLNDQIQQYCAQPCCEKPYLPELEDICITKNDRVNKWVRSVLINLPNGSGSQYATVLNIDYGDMSLVPVADIRRIPPQLVDEYPALAMHFEIKGFPVNAVSVKQIERGLEFMGIKGNATGELTVQKCREVDDKMYEIEAPDLIAAIKQ